jgi:hypothetical protein
MAPSRHASPVVVDARGEIVALKRLTLGKGGDDRGEKFLQDLVHAHPQVLPMAEIEPAFEPLISVCIELETGAGRLDNLWLTPNGGIVLGECKLIRNPQSRREVVAQALDYARAISGWHYEELEAAVRKALKSASTTLWSFVKDHPENSFDDESQFVDAIERRLRAGRLLALIIGDGIQEGAETLVGALQLHAGLHLGLSLVELSLWKGGSEELLVVPRIPLRTVIVERGIVVVSSESVTIEPPLQETAKPTQVQTLSEKEFYEQLERRRPGLAAELRSFVRSLNSLGIVPEFRKTLVLRWHPTEDYAASAGYVDTSGKVWLNDAWYWADKLGDHDAGEAYLGRLATAIGGSVRQYRAGESAGIVGSDGKSADLSDLLAVGDVWRDAIAEFISMTPPTDEAK